MKHVKAKKKPSPRNTKKIADLYGVLGKWLEIKKSTLRGSEAGNGLFTLVDLDKGTCIVYFQQLIMNLHILDVFVTLFDGREMNGFSFQELKRVFKGCKSLEYCLARDSDKFIVGNRSLHTAKGLGQFCNHR